MGHRKGLSFWQKPAFNNALGIHGPNWVMPPIQFQGVTMRVFPLRASLFHLQRLVDGYLNSSFPLELSGWFRVFLPYVYLMVIDYGKMGSQVTNLGWFSQRELTFSIPLEWYRVEAGRLLFHDWTVVSPIIFVDNELSLSIGREVYGWPKILARLGQEGSDWMRDPLAPNKVVTVSTQVLDQVYAGQRYTERVFLEVENTLAESQVRFDGRSPLLPWVGIPNAIQSAAGLLGDGITVLWRELFQRNSPGFDPRLISTAQSYLGEALRTPLDPKLTLNSVNLKQFRSASHPRNACYKALVTSQMDVERIDRLGVLGDSQVLLGDSSGGYRLRFHRYPSLSLAETFGLEGEKTQIADRAVWTVKPVLPFWVGADLRYDPAHTVTWNAGSWHLARHHQTTPKGVVARSSEEQMRIRTTDGTVAQEISGPFDFPNATVRVLPLLARKDRLRQFCNLYLNEPLKGTGMRFKPWGEYVYLLVTTYEEMSSASNNAGWWAEEEVGYYLPVKRYQDGVLHSIALVPLFCYADSPIAATTGAEVSGLPMTRGVITSPENAWLKEAGPNAGTPQSLLTLHTRALPVLGQNQPDENHLLLEIIGNGDVVEYNDHTTQRFVMANWGRTLQEQSAKMKDAAPAESLESRAGLTLALEVLANKRPLHFITFKQFRDSDEPERACYQSLIELSTELYKIYDIQEIETKLFVRVHHYPTQPIVETLGLIEKTVDTKGETLVHNLEPVRPFWMKVSMRTRLGRNLCWRSNSTEWVMLDALEKGYFNRNTSGRRQVAWLDPDKALPHWQRLSVWAQAWCKEHKTGNLLDSDRAHAAVEVLSPQLIIHKVLSREWENWGNPLTYQLLTRLNPLFDKTLGKATAATAEETTAWESLEDLVAEAKRRTRQPECQTAVASAYADYHVNPTEDHAGKLRAALLKCWLKPAFCVRGDSMKEFRVRPNRSHYWPADETWYVGPPPATPSQPSQETPPSASSTKS